jgi:hypothetical protein
MSHLRSHLQHHVIFFFKEFEDPRDADDAVYDCNGKELLGER